MAIPSASSDGTDNSLVMVPNGMLYSCAMLYGQRMSSMMRHYAKVFGLNLDTLEFFTNENPSNEAVVLDPQSTPKLCNLPQQGTIYVRQNKEKKDTG